MRISDWSSDVCSSDLAPKPAACQPIKAGAGLQTGRIGKTERSLMLMPMGDIPEFHAKRLGGERVAVIHGEDRLKWRTAERRVGKEWVSKCRYWGNQVPYKQKI